MATSGLWGELVAALEALPPTAASAAPPRAPHRRRAARIAAGPADPASYLTASLGMPRWMERLQEIDGLVRETHGRLRARWCELARDLPDQPQRFAQRWLETAATWDFGAINELIEQHNRYYPIERKLPFDLRRRDYVDMWGISWRRQPLDAVWAVAAFPPQLAAAISADPA